MAQKVKTSERYIRISGNAHSLDNSSDGRNWTNCLGTTETSATYQDLTSYKGYVLAIVSDPFYGESMKVLDRLGTVKFSSSLREKIIRFSYEEDNLLHGYDKNEIDYVLNEFDIRLQRFSWMNYNRWKDEQRRKREKDEREEERERKRKEWEKEKATKRASKSQSSPKNYSSRSYTGVKSTGGKELGCLGNLIVGVGSCLGTVLIVILLIWMLMKVFSWIS